MSDAPRPTHSGKTLRPSSALSRRMRADPHSPSGKFAEMCNLYSMTTTHEAMRKLFRVQSGINQLRFPGIFPDYPAPIIRRQANGEREVVMARWGMPTPPSLPCCDRGRWTSRTGAARNPPSGRWLIRHAASHKTWLAVVTSRLHPA